MTMKEAAPIMAARVGISEEDALTLIRAERVLHRWAEQECGDGNDHMSWAIERDEETGKPYRCFYPYKGESHRMEIPDLETRALKRVKKVCERGYLNFYHQTDPRGCALYVTKRKAGRRPEEVESLEQLTDSNYTRGFACCADAWK